MKRITCLLLGGVVVALCAGSAVADRYVTIGITAPGTTDYPNGGLRYDAVEDTLLLDPAQNDIQDAIVDHAGEYAYLATYKGSAEAIRVRLSDFSLVGSAAFPQDASYAWSAAAIDPDDKYAYFGTLNIPGRIARLDLDTFAFDNVLTLNSGEEHVISGMIGPTGKYGYFSTGNQVNPGKVIRVNLDTFTRDGEIDFPLGEYDFQAAVMDAEGKYAYYGTGDRTRPARIVKVDLESMTRVGALTFPEDSESDEWFGFFDAAIQHPEDRYAYFCTFHSPARVVRVDLTTFTVDGILTLDGYTRAYTIVSDPQGHYAACTVDPASIVKIDLDTFSVSGSIPVDTGSMWTLAEEPSGVYTYAASNSSDVGRVRRFQMSQAGYVKFTRMEVEDRTTILRTSLECHAITPPSGLRLAIYDDSAPRQLLWQSKLLDAYSPGMAVVGRIDEGTPSALSLEPGTYYLAWQTNSTGSTPGYVAGEPGDGAFLVQPWGDFPESVAMSDLTVTSELWAIKAFGRIRTPPERAEYNFAGGNEGWEFGSPPEFTSSTGLIESPEGALAIDTGDNVNTFAFWESPDITMSDHDPAQDIESAYLNASTYYGVFIAGSSITDRSRVPTMRFRGSSGDFGRSDVMVVTSSGDGCLSPIEGEMRSYAVIMEMPKDTPALRLDFDALNFQEEGDNAVGRLRLYYAQAQFVESITASAPETDVLLTPDSAEWTQFKALDAPPIPAPLFTKEEDGALSIQGNESIERYLPIRFGCWTYESNLTFKKDTVYELWWNVSTDACGDCAAEIPTIRLRVNDSEHGAAYYANLESTSGYAPLPTAADGVRQYRTYIRTPDELDGHTMHFSFDFLHTVGTDNNPAIKITLHSLRVMGHVLD